MIVDLPEWTISHDAVLQNSVWSSVMLVAALAIIWRISHRWNGSKHDTLFALSLVVFCLGTFWRAIWWVLAVITNPDPDIYIRNPWFDTHRGWLDIPTGMVVASCVGVAIALGYLRNTKCATCYGLSALFFVLGFSSLMVMLVPI